MQRRLPFIAMLSGFVGWSVAFLMIYAAQVTGCRLGWQEMALGPVSALRLLHAAAQLIHMAAIAAGNSDRAGACHGTPRQCVRVWSGFRERREAPQ